MDLLTSNISKLTNINSVEGSKFVITSDDPQIWFDFPVPLTADWYKLECNIKISLPLETFKAQFYFNFGVE